MTDQLNWTELIMSKPALSLNQLKIFNTLKKKNSSMSLMPGGSDGKTSTYNAGDPGSIRGSGRSPGEGNGNPLQYSCLENPMDGGAWWATVPGVAKSRTRLSDFTFTFHLHEYYDFTLFGKSPTSSVHIVNTCFFEMEGVVLL